VPTRVEQQHGVRDVLRRIAFVFERHGQGRRTPRRRTQHMYGTHYSFLERHYSVCAVLCCTAKGRRSAHRSHAILPRKIRRSNRIERVGTGRIVEDSHPAKHIRKPSSTRPLSSLAATHSRTRHTFIIASSLLITIYIVIHIHIYTRYIYTLYL